MNEQVNVFQVKKVEKAHLEEQQGWMGGCKVGQSVLELRAGKAGCKEV